MAPVTVSISTELDRSPARILSWGAYLACSWTWCIGMFLPVLLWRDFGVWGFVIFALPNIVGAAEMGLVLAKPGSSERFVAAHSSMCRVFSAVTIAFQAFFLVCLTRMAGGSPVLAGLLLVGGAALAVGMGIAGVEWRREAVLVWVISVAAAVWFIVKRGGVSWPAAPATGGGAPDLMGLAGLSLVCSLGFLFCPYLDLTFHTARQRTAPGPGKAAFAIGFGVLFAAMIAFTAVYAGPMLDVRLGETGALASKLGFALVAGHIVMQLLFTIGVHGSELQQARAGKWGAGVAAAFAAGVSLGFVPSLGLSDYAALSSGEVIYRLFMSFYGLVFPAYVWICASPIARTTAPTKRMLGTWLAAMAAATPFYWMGFVERESWWLIPGVAIVIAGRFFRGPREGMQPGRRT